MAYLFTIRAEHVGKPALAGPYAPRAAQEASTAIQALGRILPGDIGKRVYRTAKGVVQVENDEQRIKRQAAGATSEEI